MDSYVPVERRKHPRVHLRVKVQCYRVEEDNSRGVGILHFTSRNISAGGIFLETKIPLKVGSLIYLRFALPGMKKPLATRATIIGTQVKAIRGGDEKLEQVTGVGVEFLFLGHDEKKLIESFVSNTISGYAE